MKTSVAKKERKLIMKRDFKAPPELLFDVWSQCKHLKHWWGPKEWPIEECEMDFREGGKWRFCLRGPNAGDESWGMAIYQKIRKPEQIVYKDHFTDAQGNISGNMPDLMITVDFSPQNGKTRQTITVEFISNEDRDKIVEMGMAQGMDSSLDRMDDYLSGLNN